MEKYLIVGLGNPGPKYELTRHNAGFLVADHLAAQQEQSFVPARYAEVCQFRWKNKQVLLIKPQTYMNLSGKAVNYYLAQEKIPIERLMVITDELALPFGTLRIKPKGSDGGHNGLKNIQELLMTQGYPRLRFGVGNEFPKGGQVDYVLGNFGEEELAALPDLLKASCQALETFVLSDLQKAMSQCNS